MTKAEKTLRLQNLALRAYYDHNGEDFDDVKSEAELPKGDTLALFIWREVGDAGGDVEEAIRMMNTVKGEMFAVWNGLVYDTCLTPEERRKKIRRDYPEESEGTKLPGRTGSGVIS